MTQWKHVVVSEFGGPQVLKVVREQALPEPGLGEIRVRVLAAGTGFTDTIIRQGQYLDVKPTPPFTLGYDWFGIVDALGEGVDHLSVGDHVCDMPGVGGYTQFLCVKASEVIRAPSDLEPTEAVCMLLSYLTAYQLLTRCVSLKPGATCLVHAAGGAVGTAMLDLGRMFGYRMYGTASGAKKALVERYGGIHIDYTSEDFESRILSEAPNGVDAVFDTIGGSQWSRSYRCVKRGGSLVGFGAMHITTGEASSKAVLLGFVKLLLLWKLRPDGRGTQFYNIFQRRKKHPEDFVADANILFGLLKERRLEPAIADVLPLEDAAKAHALIDSAQVLGKLILDCR